MMIIYIGNEDSVETKVKINLIINKKDNTTVKMNINMDKLIIITSITIIFDI